MYGYDDQNLLNKQALYFGVGTRLAPERSKASIVSAAAS
jgi:hypothetical protein